MFSQFDLLLPSNSSHHHSDDAVVSVIDFLGWTYTVAWSCSFYPQIYLNWKRKSVTGLSLDFVSLDVAGFLFYSFFTTGLFWIPTVRDVYYNKHPGEGLPIELNDVLFSLHALLLTIIMTIQCCIYERGTQKVSEWCRVTLAMCWVLFVVTITLSITDTWNWLDFMYTFSYAKVAVTVLKYIPQAHLIYRRKSTLGWSIPNVILDFIGGLSCLIQMFVEAVDGDWPMLSREDWMTNFSTITKFWLCVVTIAFNCIFLTQRFVLYGNKEPYVQITNQKTDDSFDPSNSFPSNGMAGLGVGSVVAPDVVLCRGCHEKIRQAKKARQEKEQEMKEGEIEIDAVLPSGDVMRKSYGSVEPPNSCNSVNIDRELPGHTHAVVH